MSVESLRERMTLAKITSSQMAWTHHPIRVQRAAMPMPTPTRTPMADADADF